MTTTSLCLTNDERLFRRCTIGTYKRLPREKKKPHDDFVDWTLHALLWIKKRWKTAAEVVGLAALLFIVVVGAQYYWEWRSTSAAEALYAANSLEANSDGQVNALYKLVDKYSRTPAGRQGMMELGNIYLKRGEYDSAIEQFQMLAGKSRNHPMLYIAAIHKMAEATQFKGDYEAAAETYLKAAADPHNILSQQSRLRAAACLEKAGDYEQAANLYKQIIDESEESDVIPKTRSEERLIWLVANGRVQE